MIEFKNIVSFKLDDKRYPGNVYSYAHECALSIYLEKGIHNIYIQYVYDLRSSGLIYLTKRGNPTNDYVCWNYETN